MEELLESESYAKAYNIVLEVQKVLLAILANGHILIEDIPSVGKTIHLRLDFQRPCRRNTVGFSLHRTFCRVTSQALQFMTVPQKAFYTNKVYDYIARLITATRSHSFIKLGVSLRGSLALVKMSKAAAFLAGRDYVMPDDVLQVFCDVCAHRIIVSAKARLSDLSDKQILSDLAKNVPKPTIGVTR